MIADAAIRRHGLLNLVLCKDGILRHWYEAFPRPELPKPE